MNDAPKVNQISGANHLEGGSSISWQNGIMKKEDPGPNHESNCQERAGKFLGIFEGGKKDTQGRKNRPRERRALFHVSVT